MIVKINPNTLEYIVTDFFHPRIFLSLFFIQSVLIPYLPYPTATLRVFFLFYYPSYIDVARRLLITGIANFPHSKNIGWFHAALASLSRQDGKGKNQTAREGEG